MSNASEQAERIATLREQLELAELRAALADANARQLEAKLRAQEARSKLE